MASALMGNQQAWDVANFFKVFDEDQLLYTIPRQVSYSLIGLLVDSIIVTESRKSDGGNIQLIPFAKIFYWLGYAVSLASIESRDFELWTCFCLLAVMAAAAYFYTWPSGRTPSHNVLELICTIVRSRVMWRVVTVMLFSALYVFTMSAHEKEYMKEYQIAIFPLSLLSIAGYYLLRHWPLQRFLLISQISSIALLFTYLLLYYITDVSSFVASVLVFIIPNFIRFGFIIIPYLVLCAKLCQIGLEVSAYNIYQTLLTISQVLSVHLGCFLGNLVEGGDEEHTSQLTMAKIGLMIVPLIFYLIFKSKIDVP